MSTLTYHMNRLAGTLDGDVPTLDAQGAANKWAGLGGAGGGSVTNPSFETDTTGWDGSGATISRVVGPAAHGDAYLRVEANATSAAMAEQTPSNYMTVAPGETWTLSSYAINESGGRTLALRIRWRDAADTILSEDVLPGVTPDPDWATRLVLTATAPAGAAKAEARLLANGTGLVGDRAGFDAVMFNRGSTAQPFSAGKPLALVGALNHKAGNTLPNYKELQGVLNQLAGTTGLGVVGAAARIP